jgi:hypothetical protein
MSTLRLSATAAYPRILWAIRAASCRAAARHTPQVKTRTLDQVSATKAKAVRFQQNVVGDTDRADEIEDMSP